MNIFQFLILIFIKIQQFTSFKSLKEILGNNVQGLYNTPCERFKIAIPQQESRTLISVNPLEISFSRNLNIYDFKTILSVSSFENLFINEFENSKLITLLFYSPCNNRDDVALTLDLNYLFKKYNKPYSQNLPLITSIYNIEFNQPILINFSINNENYDYFFYPSQQTIYGLNINKASGYICVISILNFKENYSFTMNSNTLLINDLFYCNFYSLPIISNNKNLKNYKAFFFIKNDDFQTNALELSSIFLSNFNCVEFISVFPNTFLVFNTIEIYSIEKVFFNLRLNENCYLRSIYIGVNLINSFEISIFNVSGSTAIGFINLSKIFINFNMRWFYKFEIFYSFTLDFKIKSNTGIYFIFMNQYVYSLLF